MKKYVAMLAMAAFIIALLLFTVEAEAQDVAPRQTVNILTWWGYLNHPEIVNAVENECNVKISFDEYYSNDEFLRRWEGQKDSYDVIIFSDTIYNIVKDKIPHFSASTLWQQSTAYHPVIKAHYAAKKYPHSVVYFFHAMTGFLWNPNNIMLTKKDSIAIIFNKAKQKIVVLMDDPVEVEKLIEAGTENVSPKTKGEEALSTVNFKKIVQESTVYITNNYSQIYKKSEFSFSFSWSGEAIVDLMESNKNYQFLIHPKLSYVSSDLIAQTSNNKSALCVAMALSSRKTASAMQLKGYYFSPYAEYSEQENPIFKFMYENFKQSLSTLKWTDSIDANHFNEINKSWQLIKLSLNNKFRGV